MSECEVTAEPTEIARRMQQIKHKLVVLSGKGGVGKSTVASNLARALNAKGYNVGLLDADIHGPSIPTLFNLGNSSAQQFDNELIPLDSAGIKLMSSGFLLADPDQAVIVRGPMKNKLLGQMLGDVAWGELDYLIIDCPPGTGDEPLAVCQHIDLPDGAIVVTTPQEVVAADVRKSIQFCRKIDLPILGIIQNMSQFSCPKCGELIYLFGKDGGRRTCEKYNVAFLGDIPIDPAVGVSGDAGECFLKKHTGSSTAEAFQGAVDQINVSLGINAGTGPEAGSK